MSSIINLSNTVALDQVQQLPITDSTTTRLYLIRHGESLFNRPDVNGIVYTSGKSLDIPLTETGKEQAKTLAKKLSTKLPTIKPMSISILSSTAVRAKQTAEIIFEKLRSSYSNKQIETDEGLCELGQGKWEGTPKDGKFKEQVEIWNKLSAKDQFTIPKLSTGESYQTVANRALTSLQKIITEHQDRTLFIVSHNAAMNAIAIQLSGHADQLSSDKSKLPTISFGNCDMLLIELQKGKQINQAKIVATYKSKI